MSVRLQQPQEQRYPRTEGKCLTISIWLDTPERVVTCCQCQWPHTTRLKELWRVTSSSDLTRHAWKSCDALPVPVTSHDTSERVVTCCQCQWPHTTRLKDSWRVVNASDITRHVFLSFISVYVTMSHKCRMPLLERWAYLNTDKDKKRQTTDPRPSRRFDGIRFLEAASISKITGDKSALLASPNHVQGDTQRKGVWECQGSGPNSTPWARWEGAATHCLSYAKVTVNSVASSPPKRSTEAVPFYPHHLGLQLTLHWCSRGDDCWHFLCHVPPTDQSISPLVFGFCCCCSTREWTWDSATIKF